MREHHTLETATRTNPDSEPDGRGCRPHYDPQPGTVSPAPASAIPEREPRKSQNETLTDRRHISAVRRELYLHLGAPRRRSRVFDTAGS